MNIDHALKVLESVAMSLLNTPYKWGGNSPMEGLDCSGFALILLRTLGIISTREDMTADMLDNYLMENGGIEDVMCAPGRFIFYGRTKEDKATHVMYCLNNYQVIGAVGGGRKTRNLEDAIRHEAYVKILPWDYRKDVIRIVDIKTIINNIYVGGLNTL